ncbi:MAG: group I truncated hemoglobin [Hyphomicrobium sp.]
MTKLFGLVSAAALLAFNLSAGPVGAEEKSLYERIGGYKAVAAASDHLVDKLYVNTTLNKNPAIKAVHDLNERAAFKLILSTWVIENTGGPKVYIGRPMDKAHAHLSITDKEFDIIMLECQQTFYQLGVPQKELDELMAGLQSNRDMVVTVKN